MLFLAGQASEIRQAFVASLALFSLRSMLGLVIDRLSLQSFDLSSNPSAFSSLSDGRFSASMRRH